MSSIFEYVLARECICSRRRSRFVRTPAAFESLLHCILFHGVYSGSDVTVITM